MNKNFIILAGLALFATGSSFASTETVIELPAHVVTASRRTDAERAIDASLAELRAVAKTTPSVSTQPELPLRELAKKTPAPTAPVVAKVDLTTLVAIKA